MSRSSSNAFSLGAFMAGAGVLFGAFGAHALSWLPPARLAWWHTSTQYLFIAAFGIMLYASFQRTTLRPRSPVFVLAMGALLFCGSLYAMALGAPRWLGMVTPVGGLALVSGFVWMGVSSLRAR
jgi:uncharacterized membrane protein YgdD (TMEM256/DUF423 family)